MIEVRTHKTCRYCGCTKETQFFRHNRNKCLECHKLYIKNYNQKKRESRPTKVKVIKTSKTCSKCNETKPLELFRKTGLICLNCRRKDNQLWREQTEKELASSAPFIERKGIQFKARKCNRCSQVKEVKFFKQLNQTCIYCKRQSKIEVLERQKLREEAAAKATHKTCIRCKITKKIGEGISEKKNPYCRDCSNEINRIKYAKNGGKEKFRIKRQTNLAYNIETKLRSRLRGALREGGGIKKQRTEALIGCSFKEFREHLESKMKPGMTMEKVLSAEIVLDHIIPCSLFDLTNQEEQQRCFHYSNIQPLWKFDNDIKYDRYMGMKCRKIPKTIKKIDKLIEMVYELYNIE